MKFSDFFKKVIRKMPKSHLVYYNIIRFLPMSEERLRKELDGKIFLITSTGRTGTTLFSNMLDQSSEAQVVHEPVDSEQYFHRLALEDPEFSCKYVSNFRLKDVYLRKRAKRYGEVNSALRRNVKEIKHCLPKTPIVHVVRDGYDVVSSVLNRKTLTDKDWCYNTMIPHSSIISRDEWLNFSRFEKICFMWAEENRWLSEVCDVSAEFERLIDDYDYFSQMISDVVGIRVTEERWSYFLKKKINPNVSYDKNNSPRNWTAEQHKQFERICGNEMMKYGYKIFPEK